METKHSTSELVLFRPGTRAQVGESIIIKVDKKKQEEGLVLSHLPSNSLIGWVGIVLTEQIGYWGHRVLGTLGIGDIGYHTNSSQDLHLCVLRASTLSLLFCFCGPQKYHRRCDLPP